MTAPAHGARARRLLSRAATLLGAQLLVRAASLVAFPLLANSVEPHTFGVYLYSLQLAAAWAVLANFQLRAALIEALGDETADPVAARLAVRQAVTIRLALALVVAVVTGLWCLTRFDGARERWLFELLLAGTLLTAVGASFDEALQAREALRWSALAAVIQGLLVSGGIIYGVLVAGRPIVWAVGSQVVAAGVWFALVWYLARRLLGGPVLRPVWAPALARGMLLLAVGVAATGQAGAWYGRVDLLAVERLLGPARLGVYAVPYRALEVILTGVMSLHVALLPMLARARAAGPEALRPRLETCLRFGLLTLLPLCGVLALLAPQVLLLFKPEYADGAGPLRLLLWVAALTFVDSVLHWVLFFHHRPWQPCLTLLAALATNYLLCRLLIGPWGLVGAATARLCAEGLIVGLSAALVHRVQPVAWGSVSLKPILMTLALVAGWLLLDEPWWLGLLAGAAAWLLAGWLLKPLEPREWELVRSLLRRGG